MKLLHERLGPLQRNARFFASVDISGGHRDSLRWRVEGRAELAAIDSVTFGYLARFAPQEVAGLRIVPSSAVRPSLLYVTALSVSE